MKVVTRCWSVRLICESHNELDLPGITQPVMYEKISARRSVPQLYEQKLMVNPFPYHYHILLADLFRLGRERHERARDFYCAQ